MQSCNPSKSGLDHVKTINLLERAPSLDHQFPVHVLVLCIVMLNFDLFMVLGQVHLLVSTRPDEKAPIDGRPFLCLSILRSKSSNADRFVEVPALADTKKLLEHHLRLQHRRVTESQIQALVRAAERAGGAARTPLRMPLLAAGRIQLRHHLQVLEATPRLHPAAPPPTRWPPNAIRSRTVARWGRHARQSPSSGSNFCLTVKNLRARKSPA